jgi:hypothetical protein
LDDFMTLVIERHQHVERADVGTIRDGMYHDVSRAAATNNIVVLECNVTVQPEAGQNADDEAYRRRHLDVQFPKRQRKIERIHRDIRRRADERAADQLAPDRRQIRFCGYISGHVDEPVPVADGARFGAPESWRFMTAAARDR